MARKAERWFVVKQWDMKGFASYAEALAYFDTLEGPGVYLTTLNGRLVKEK